MDIRPMITGFLVQEDDLFDLASVTKISATLARINAS